MIGTMKMPKRNTMIIVAVVAMALKFTMDLGIPFLVRLHATRDLDAQRLCSLVTDSARLSPSMVLFCR